MRAVVAAARSRPQLHPHPRNRLKTSRFPREPLRAALAENMCLLMGGFLLQPQKGASPYRARRARWARAHGTLPPEIWRNRDGIPGELPGHSGGSIPGGIPGAGATVVRRQCSVAINRTPSSSLRCHDALMP